MPCIERLSALLFFTVASVFVTGCATNFDPDPAIPGRSSLGAIQGKVHGGNQPVIGARVYVYAAAISGYGGNGIAASTLNASVSLLNAAVLTNSPLNSGMDTSGNYYITTAADGSFALGGDYTCTPGTQVYLYALGGNPGAGINSASGFMAALGQCPAATNLAATVPYVWVNEVSTVAAAYALAGFATDATHIGSSGTALAQTGIANAFANAANLAGIATGAAIGTLPAASGTAPRTTVNSLADILTACVNTSGPTSANCNTLLTTATSDGTPSGVVPTDTATAAINIAHHPGLNVAALYTLLAGQTAFTPTLTSQPNDFTVALSITSGGFSSPMGIAIDGLGNAWVASEGSGSPNTGSSIAKISPTAAILSGTSGFTGGGLSEPVNLAIDTSNNVWVTNLNTSAITKLSNTGSFLSGSGFPASTISFPEGICVDATGSVWIANYSNNVTEMTTSGTILSGTNGFTGGGLNGPTYEAIDGLGHIWVSNGNNSLSEFSNAGIALTGASGITGAGMNYTIGIAIDGSNNIWTANFSGNSVSKLSNAGASLSGTAGFTGSGISRPYSIAIDGAGTAWVADSNTTTTLVNLSASGTVLSGATGYLGGGTSGRRFVAIDGSGNVWVTNWSSNTVSIYLGLAAPLITPMATSIAANTLGSRP